jgi:RNA-directed DNA polymerase
MEHFIHQAIIKKCRSLLRKEERRRYIIGKYRSKHKLRTGTAAKITPFRAPSIWSVSSHFDPRYCLKNAKFLARVIWKRIQEGKYEPAPAIQVEIPKPNGEKRTIMVFAIPDAAVANAIFAKLRDKNARLFSPFSYAYLRDRGLFDAIIQLRSHLSGGQSYLLEMDFSKYFDTIEHRYLEYLFEQGEFNFSSAELYTLRAFLRHRISTVKNYQVNSEKRRTRGVPQGSSVSLFLANLAGHELDRRLEAANGRFVRFADDVVVVTETHRDAVHAAQSFEEHCKFSGISVNHKKSEGISLFSPRSKLDARSFFVNIDDGHDLIEKTSFDYLGHKFTREKLQLSSRAIIRAKNRVAKIIYLNLLYSLQFGFSTTRVSGSGFDWDLVTCINEIRRYIYGSITETEIDYFITKGTTIRPLRGFVGFCALVDDIQQFRELDGWMVDILQRALKKRYAIIAALTGSVAKVVPSHTMLIDGGWHHSTLGVDTKLPSFARAWRAARKRFKLHGLKGLKNPSYYSDFSSSAEGIFYEN